MIALSLAFPVLTFLLLWAIFHDLQADWRSAFLSAAILSGGLLVVITEILSLLRWITFAGALIAWIIFFLVSLAAWVKAVRDRLGLWKALNPVKLRGAELLLLAGSIFIACLVGLTAWFAAPNTYDSMTYHLPRVMHWIQDLSLDFYPTHILRQLYLNPGSEFVILHLHLLTGGDRLDNYVQWFSMVASAVGVSLVARELGIGRGGQFFAALATLALPVGIVEGSSTQTDYVSAFWLVCCVFWMLAWRTEAHPGRAAAAGASLGLAILAKSTAYIFAIPFLIWLGLLILQRYQSRAALPVAIAALALISLNLGTFVRDQRLFGNPLGITAEPSVHTGLFNDVFSVRVLASNVIRNAAQQLGTPFPSLNSAMEEAVVAVHRLIGISENDPRTTWPGTKFEVRPLSLDEDHSGNLLHSALIVVAMLITFFGPASKRGLPIYASCVPFAFLLFCVLLKWQPWNARLHLALFVLATPVLAAAVERVGKAWVLPVLACCLMAAALPWLFLNPSRPLLGNDSVLTTDRAAQFFHQDSGARKTYTAAAQRIKAFNPQCRQVGLYLAGNDWEYPFWMALHQKFGADVQIEAVQVENISKGTYREFPELAPCAILAVNWDQGKTIRIGGTEYVPVWTSAPAWTAPEGISVLQPQ